MVGVGNGFAAYQRGMFIPYVGTLFCLSIVDILRIMSTFFMFWLYAAPAVRMSALMKLRFIGFATHDAIGIGEDGPTHQPIALAAFYRALPGINLIRPADAEEVVGAWLIALNEDCPSLFALSRQGVPLLEGTNREGVAKGAYIVHGGLGTPDITLVATGAEVYRAIEAAKLLVKETHYEVRVVSMPSMKHFDRQPASYRRSILPTSKSLVVAIEAWHSFGWARYAHAGCHMHTFGHSAPAATLYEHFGFSPGHIAEKVGKWAKGKRKEGGGWDVPGVGEFEELLLGHVNKD